jgi:DNA-binding NarL/FixJ family response regulator
MPIMDGREALHILRKKYQNTIKIIILSIHYSEEHIRKYMKAGADGYLSKDSDFMVLLEAIQSVYDKGYYFYDKVSPQLVSELVNKDTPFPTALAGEPLSEREIEVIKLLCLGMTSPQIAEKIKLSIRTIENHRHRISKKIGAHNTADIIVYAIKYGFHKIDY